MIYLTLEENKLWIEKENKSHIEYSKEDENKPFNMAQKQNENEFFVLY